MSISEAEAKEAWRLFERSPLFTKWPGAAAQFNSLLEPVSLPPDGVIYSPGDLATYLYLLVAGRVDETVGADEKLPWLRRQYSPGDFFGHNGLFAGKYQGRAWAEPGARLYRMSAAGLRTALEQNTALQDELRQERRAGRLRRIPLFSSLSDGQLRWLAQVVKERDFASDAPLPLDAEPGLWVVDWGQIQVTGPANPTSDGDAWGITAGNFFVGAGPGMRYGHHCVARTAQAALATHLFYLPLDAVDRLADAFPDIQRRMAKPADIVEQMARVPLFASLPPRNIQHLAQNTAWEYEPAGQNITTQGSLGHSFVIIRDGAAVVTAIDERGRGRPRSYLKAGSYYGETSLLQGAPRDATVRAVKAPAEDNPNRLNGAEVLVLNRLDMQYAFVQEPSLWHTGVSLFDRTIQIKEEKQPYKWMDEGETVEWTKRRHWLWLWLPELAVFGVGLLAFVVIWLLEGDVQRTLAVSALACGLPALILLMGWIYLNYQDDYYVLTNRRVTRRDRTLMLTEARVEAPLDVVQDVTVETDLLARLFNYGTVSVRTASKDWVVRLLNVPDPETVKSDILVERTEARALGQGLQYEVLRRGLLTGLQLSLPVPERARALGEKAVLPPKGGRLPWGRSKTATQSQELLPGVKSSQPVRGAARALPEKWQTVLFGPPKPPPKPLTGQVIWRKHWVNLLGRTILPLAAVVLLAVMGLIIILTDPPPFGLSRIGLMLPWLVAMAAASVWLWWNYEDWHNDIYVLTDDKIIDIERKPLGLQSKRREGSLERVQNVLANQKGIIPNLLDFGDVVISTAAGDEGYTFNMVPHPKQVQSLVFQNLDKYRQRQKSEATRQRQNDLIEAIQVYHQLRDEQAG
jgi:CRP-like cAMP-binding protein/membrane protein YdbS with pleckstrin-like domain